MDINNNATTISLDHDYGVVNRGDKIEHSFIVENDSQVPWKVQKTFVTCSCTGVLLSIGDSFSAGETKEISVVFDAGDQLGKRAEVATIYFEDQRAPVLSFRVTADVRNTGD